MFAHNNMLDIRFIPFKSKPKPTHIPNKKIVPPEITKSESQRTQVIEWVQRAQRTIDFSRSTFFLAIALLDKLLILKMTLTDSNFQLVAGTLVMIVTKFNEVYPITIRKINALSFETYPLEKYVEIESMMLKLVNFDISPNEPIYQELSELEDRLGKNSQAIIRIAVENPGVLFGCDAKVLQTAIQTMEIGGIMQNKNGSRLHEEVVELRKKLTQLKNNKCTKK